MQILVIEPHRYNATARAMLAKAAEVRYEAIDTREGILEAARLRPFEVLFTRLGIAHDRSLLDRLPHLRWIVTPTTGLDHIDQEACMEKGIEVISLKGETAFLNQVTSTAEHTWALLLALLRKLPTALQSVAAGRWERESLMGRELKGKTLGIIGLGRLGRMVAAYGLAFGMEVITFDIDPMQWETRPESLSNVGYRSLEELLGQSDVVSLHIPSNAANAAFFNAKCFLQMKYGAILINTARGEVVEEDALLEGLLNGKIAAAGLDVLNGDSSWESFSPKNHPLIKYMNSSSNLLITSHIGGYSKEAIENTGFFIVNKFLKTIANEAKGN